MEKKKGRPRKKKHDPIPASFNEVLSAIAKSKYMDEKKLKVKKKK